MDLDERIYYNFDDFKRVFLLTRSEVMEDQIDISESLNQFQQQGQDEDMGNGNSSTVNSIPTATTPTKTTSSSSKKHNAKDPYVDMPMRDIEPCTSFVPANSKKYTPPAQMMTREWSIIFSQRVLSNRDLDNANLACRFFRTVLFKFPPENWRVLCLSSLERRTAENMVSFVQWQRLRSICRLEVGTFTFANMLKDEDLQVIFVSLHNLRSLKLYWCHLITLQVWSTIRCETLRSLSLKTTAIDLDAAVVAFPNLEELKMWSCVRPRINYNNYKTDGVDQLASSLPLFAKLRKLYLCQECPLASLSTVCKGLKLTHLWVARENFYDHGPELDPMTLRRCVEVLKPTLQKLIGPTLKTEEQRLNIIAGTNVIYIETRRLLAMPVQKPRAGFVSNSNYQQEEIDSMQKPWNEI